MPTEPATEVEDAIERILGYLSASPNASDTVAAVADWWLDRGIPIDSVQRALERLVEDGTLTAKTLAGGTVVYARTDRALSPTNDKGDPHE